MRARFITLASIGIALVAVSNASAQRVPFRLSFKFILDSSGNRPATGNINTQAEIDAQVATGSAIHSQLISEFSIDEVEVVDVSGHSEFATTDVTTATRDALRNAALADQTGFHWRTDAVNVYISGASVTGISDFTPNNNIIVVGQASFKTTVAHEVGHVMNLYHTHEPNAGGDSCTDTIADNPNWTKDDIANNNFGNTYANITPAQQAQVDAVWTNLMSYHDPDNRKFLTSCQMDRQSTQGYADRYNYLTRWPIYIDSGYTGFHTGAFLQPYQTFQAALNAGGFNTAVFVLESGNHVHPTSSVTTPCSLVTRRATSNIQEAPPPYDLPYNVQQSENPAVRAAVLKALERDRAGDIKGVITNLVEAEASATGREKTALQMEIAQRHESLKQYQQAETWFRKAAEGADQVALQKKVTRDADEMKAKASASPAQGATSQ